MHMPEVLHVYATVRNPTKGRVDDPGQVTTGYYTLVDGVLMMTDSKGAPVHDLNSGEKILHKMQLDDDATVIAKRLTMKIYRMLRGETAPTVTGFGRTLNYPTSGVA
jgi:hypothetical protein